MAMTKSRTNFLESELGISIRETLRDMMGNTKYNTASSYSSDTEQYPDKLIPFDDKHMNYLTSHPRLDADMYISNLQLMTRVR